MIMENVFKNSNVLSHAIKDIADIDLTPRPWNRFDPDNTIWWLVSSTDWPAYKYGKLFFDSRIGNTLNNKSKIYYGFNVEKGLGNRNFYHNSLIINNEWLWKEFIVSLSKITIPDKSIFTIKASYMVDKIDSSDPQEVLEQKERLRIGHIFFDLDKELTLSLLKKEINSTDLKVLNYFHKIAECQNIVDVSSLLLQIPDTDWIWVDLYIGHLLSKDNNISIEEMWEKRLSLWKPWLRKSKI